MRPTTELFDLIKAMTQNEKRYFKVWVGKNQDSTYIKLFDAIDRQAHYDEVAIKKEFRDEAFIKQLHVAKNYLYRVILKSLATFHAHASHNAMALELLRFIEVLYEKGFYKQCEKMIQSGIALCKKYEKPLLHTQFLEWKAKVLSRNTRIHELLNNLYEEKKALKNMLEILAYKEHAFRIYDDVVKIGVARNTQDIKRIKQRLNNPLLKKNPALLESEYYKLSCYGLVASATSSMKKHHDYTRKMVKLFQDHPHLIEEYPLHYVTSLNNHCNALLNLKRIEQAKTIINLMRNLGRKPDGKSWDNAYLLSQVLSHDLEVLVIAREQRFEQLVLKAQEVEQFLKQHQKKLKKSHVLDLIYDIAHSFFMARNFDLALYWLIKILQDNDYSLRHDIYSASRILNLVVHYELRNQLLLGSIIKSTRTFLAKKGRLYRTEKVLLNFLQRAHSILTRHEEVKLLKQMKAQLKRLAVYPEENQMLHYFQVHAWIDAKIKELSQNKST